MHTYAYLSLDLNRKLEINSLDFICLCCKMDRKIKNKITSKHIYDPFSNIHDKTFKSAFRRVRIYSNEIKFLMKLSSRISRNYTKIRRIYSNKSISKMAYEMRKFCKKIQLYKKNGNYLHSNNKRQCRKLLR